MLVGGWVRPGGPFLPFRFCPLLFFGLSGDNVAFAALAPSVALLSVLAVGSLATAFAFTFACAFALSTLYFFGTSLVHGVFVGARFVGSAFALAMPCTFPNAADTACLHCVGATIGTVWKDPQTAFRSDGIFIHV